MTRRTTGGNVRRHATRDLWEARYVGADGRRHSVYARTEKAAQEKLRTALHNADAGIRPVGSQLTVATFLNDWLATSVRQRCRPRTAESYAETVSRYITPAIGRMREVDKPYRERIARLLADETTDPRGRAILANQMERMEASNLSPYWPTPRVAKWIARLRRWLPDLEGAGDYILLATWYAAREARNAPTDDLDARMAAIAARHWQGEEEGK